MRAAAGGIVCTLATMPLLALAGAALLAAGVAHAASRESYVLTLDGQVLGAEEPDLARAPASLTKLLTALVVLDAGVPPERWLTASARVAASKPSRLGLRSGESLRAEDALTAMLVHSANDACELLVEHTTPTLGQFVERMNRKARMLGMSASHFSSPCGFDAPDQFATAKDLLRLAQAVWAIPDIRRIASLRDASVRTRAGRVLHFRTTNALLGRLDGVVGLKTGFTSAAGTCLVAVAERGDHRVWLVMLGAQDRWWSAHRLISAALAGSGAPQP